MVVAISGKLYGFLWENCWTARHVFQQLFHECAYNNYNNYFSVSDKPKSPLLILRN